jgi:hypothetical protein
VPLTTSVGNSSIANNLWLYCDFQESPASSACFSGCASWSDRRRLTQRVEAETHNVSPTGALVILSEPLPQGMKIKIETFNEKKLEADVVGHRSSVRRARSSRSNFPLPRRTSGTRSFRLGSTSSGPSPRRALLPRRQLLLGVAKSPRKYPTLYSPNCIESGSHETQLRAGPSDSLALPDEFSRKTVLLL